MRSRKALINMTIGLIYEAVLAISGIVIPRLILLHYGSTVNGMIQSINQFLSFVALLRAGVGGVTRAALYRPLEEKNKTQIMRVLKATQDFMRKIALIFLIAVVLLASIYWLFVNKQFAWEYCFILVLILGVGTFSQYYFGMTYQLLLQADQKMYVWNLWQLFATVLNVIVTVFLVLSNQSILLVKLGTAIVFSIFPIIASIYVKRKYEIDLNVTPDNSAIAQRWSAFTYQVATYVHENTDVVVITIIKGVNEVSVYSVYSLVINSCIRRVIETVFNGFDAALGNMIARKEQETIDQTMNVFEMLTTMLSSILYSCVVVLMSSFVAIYTAGVNDADYQRPVFLVLIVLAEFIYCLRIPYYSIITAKGLYKETQKGAIIEAALNLGISLVLVYHLGLVGVAIGTCFAMAYRYLDMLIFTSKRVIKRKPINLLKFYSSGIIVFVFAYLINKLFPINTDSLGKWFVYSFLFFCSITILGFIVNLIINPKESLLVYGKIFRIFKRKDKTST